MHEKRNFVFWNSAFIVAGSTVNKSSDDLAFKAREILVALEAENYLNCILYIASIQIASKLHLLFTECMINVFLKDYVYIRAGVYVRVY